MRTTLFAVTGLALVAACGDDNNNQTPDASVQADAAVPDGAVAPGEKLVVSPVSATGHDHFFGVAYDAAGNIYTTGQVAPGTDAATDYACVVAKFSSTGELDKTFGTQGYAIRNVAVGANGELCRGIVIQSDGKIVVSGTIEHAGAADARDRDIALLRFTAAGAKDTTFGTDGVVTLDLSTGVVSGTAFVADSVWGLAKYPDDRLVLSAGRVRTGGTDTDFAVVRLTKDGAYDNTFATNGVFSLDLEIPDPTNGNALKHNNASPRNIELLPGTEGIIAAGYQGIPGRDTEMVIYKLTDAGALDTTFSTNGIYDDYLLEEQAEAYVARKQGNKIVTTGYGRDTAAQTTDVLSVRLLANGTLDTTYGTNGMVKIDVAGFADNSRDMLVLPDNRILLAGGGRPATDNLDGWIALLTADGAPDTKFSAKGWKTVDLGGPADFLWSLALSPDHKTVAFVGFKGVGSAPAAGANDDAVLYLLPLPQ